MLHQIYVTTGGEGRRDLRTHGGELRRRGRIQRVVGGRELVEEGRHVHVLDAVEALGTVQRPDLRPQAAHHEILEDPRRRPHLRRRTRLITDLPGWILGAAVGASLSLWCRSCTRASGRREAVRRRTRPDGGCAAGGRRRGPAGWRVVCFFDPLRIWRQLIFFPSFCLCLTVLVSKRLSLTS